MREHDTVRRALGRQYRHIFIDEFQDTDPIQAEILFLIAADDRAPRWPDSALRAGALFMVGDPKQSIYRFRGADIGSYARRAPPSSGNGPTTSFKLLPISARGPRSSRISTAASRALSSGDGQPGYVPLAQTL